MSGQRLILGCVADDFTGGSDAASFMALGGMRTVFINGIPGKDFKLPDGCEGVVIALKSRTQKTSDAVADSLQAIRWLKAQGASQFYFKYCSTFDSTPQGNIGPVTDAILEELDLSCTLLCPSLPANDRRVRGGILYVKGVPLAESPMRNHPLTPMTQSRIADLMAPQGKYQSLEIHRETLYGNDAALFDRIGAFIHDHGRAYLIPDFDNDADAERIVRLFGHMPFLTGGSGLLTALARRIVGPRASEMPFPGTEGRAILVAGSCSTATNAQILWYEAHGGYLVRLPDEGLLDGSVTPEGIWAELQARQVCAPLVYAYDTPEGLATKRNEAGRALAARIEAALSGLAVLARRDGVNRIISAGGETSGAVTQALGYRAFWVSESIAPGVPILIPVEDTAIRLVLKSGNFGQEDFFGRALKLTGLQDTFDGTERENGTCLQETPASSPIY